MNPQEIVEELHAVLEKRLDYGTGEYLPRHPGDTANALLCEILGLVSDGKQGDTWEGSGG